MLVGSTDPSIDYTDAMTAFADKRVRALANENLCGYVFKSRSPSCGVFRVPVYGGAQPQREGRGLFAARVIEAMPELPVEEEGRLLDAGLRENFVERVFAFSRLRALFASNWSLGDLVAFHSKEKLLLLAHRPESYKELGRLVAASKEVDRQELKSSYRKQFLEGMARPASLASHVNVLQHILGNFKDHLASEDRRELLSVIEDYRVALVPLIVPVTLLRFFIRRHKVDYLATQTYLSPHPKELMLRNRV